jgi:adenylate cyclase
MGVLAMTALCYAAILYWSYWIPLVPPVIGFLLTGGLAASYAGQHVRQERAVLMQLFSKHVSPDIAEAIWRDRKQFLEGKRPKPQHLTATVLATDIEGFTTVSEKLDPGSLLHWLNEYMEAMAHQVVTHHGVVDKYIGDAIMAVFGVPIARQTTTEIANDAVNAVNCALAMERDIIRLNRVWQARGMPIVRMRAGIYTGSLVAGTLGSADRLQYTVIGDTVNTAFRLESYDKNSADTEFPDRTCRILVGDSTRELLGDVFETRRVGDVSLKGKDQQILIHYVVKQAREVTQST